ncbi:MAG: ABC transporter permease [Anaerolineales bacterium]|jgi:ABC-2 type transport system permease protein|nr:ABC transporter permease [Anaerolineales bacterium]MCW5887727.1 ABC transporter permease [Anaerolineales bacterium]
MTEIATPHHLPSAQPGLLARIGYFIRKTLNIAEMEMRKLRHEPTDLLTRAAQPVLWILIFGQVMARVRAIPTGEIGYLEFMSPGILAQSMLFISIFYGISIIWERDLGIIHKFLAGPAPRAALVLGKGLSAGVRGISQILIIYPLAYVLGVQLDFHLLSLVGTFVTVMLGAVLFSTFSLFVAIKVKTRERFMGIGQFMTMPLFFASNAIYPIEMMPGWLQTISRFNPLTYVVDALRTFMLQGGESHFGLGTDFAVLLLVSAFLVWAAGRAYPGFVN